MLIHCRAGISRSATICIAYLMYAGHFSLDEAHDYLKRRRPLISPNLNFMRQLAEFETSLQDGVDIRRAPRDLVGSVVRHCTGGLVPPKPPPPPLPEVQDARRKRKALSDLLLPCGPTPSAAKVSRVALPPPPTPCKQQTFVFDLATVAVLMSSRGATGSPPMSSQSPLVSPS